MSKTATSQAAVDSAFINNLTVLVTEIRKVRGLFYERLEINNFPLDLHELSIVVASRRSRDEVLLVDDKAKPTLINTARFYDRQEWSAFSFCKTTEREFVDRYNGITNPQILLTCFVARRHQLNIFISTLNNPIKSNLSFYFSAFLLIFLIAALGFATFAIGVTAPQNRITILCILLLTAINFRWIIAQRLPSVSYMTFLDKFAIGAIINNSLLISWDALADSFALSSSKT